MKIFLDTSSLFKLYHQEEGTDELEDDFENIKVTHIFLSEVTKIEFSSTIWEKVRTKEITLKQAEITLKLFESDFEKYNFFSTDSLVLEHARNLVTKYGLQGLRTLDSIQLAACIILAGQVEVFYTADKLLKTLIESEGLKTSISIY